jgi:hypothetical protein
VIVKLSGEQCASSEVDSSGSQKLSTPPKRLVVGSQGNVPAAVLHRSDESKADESTADARTGCADPGPEDGTTRGGLTDGQRMAAGTMRAHRLPREAQQQRTEPLVLLYGEARVHCCGRS